MASVLNGLPPGFELDSPAPSALPPGFELDQPHETPGFIDRVAADWHKRGQNLSNIQNMQDSGAQGLPENTLQAFGQVAGGLNDLVGEGVKSAVDVGEALTPDAYINAMGPTADALYNSRPMQDFRGAGQEIQDFEAQNPRAGRNLDAVANIAMAAPVVGGVMDAARAAPDAISSASDAMGNLKDALKNMKPAEKTPTITADQARRIGGMDFDAVTQGGHVFPESLSDKYVNAVKEYLPQDAAEQVIIGDDPVVDFGKNIDDLSGKKLTIQNVMKLDTKLGNMVDRFTENGKLKAEGLPFQQLQDKLRAMVNEEPEVSEELNRARANWADSYKLRDIERINTHAENMPNPAQARQAGFRALAENPNKLPMYTPQQQEWIKQAAKSSFTNDFLRGIGSRLNPLAAGAVGATAGPLGAAMAYGGTTLVSKGARKLADYLQSLPGKNVVEDISQNIFDRFPDYTPPTEPPPATPAAPLGLPAPSPEFSADSFGNVAQMTPEQKLAAALKRQQAADMGMTPDVTANIARHGQRAKNAAGFSAAEDARKAALLKALAAKYNGGR